MGFVDKKHVYLLHLPCPFFDVTLSYFMQITSHFPIVEL